MPFDPKQYFNIEVAGVATIVLSVVALACLLFSVW